MPPATKLEPLDEREKAEFDNIRYDEIHECKDVKKLMRLEAYMREQGFATTADAATSRLRELGQRAANSELDPEQARLLAQEQARASADIAAWASKQRVTDAALEAASKEVVGSGRVEGAPPVRNPLTVPVAPTAPPPAPAAKGTSNGPKADSAVGTQVRSGREYYERWEKKAEAALAEIESSNAAASDRAAASAAATAASTAGLARSPELTQRLLDLNRGASPAERLVLSANEKVKGNEHFRAREFAEAVEHYTLALGLRGAAGEPSLFSNRAAAYLKLKMYDAAEQDATAALEADPANLKAYIRRAAARLEMGRMAEVVADCDAALALAPDSKDARDMRDKAAKLLEDAGMKRMKIEEVDDDDEEEGDGEEGLVGAGKEPEKAPAPKPQQPAPAARTKLQVVEETDSEDEEEEAPAKGAAAAAAAATPAAPQPNGSATTATAEAPASSHISNGVLTAEAAKAESTRSTPAHDPTPVTPPALASAPTPTPAPSPPVVITPAAPEPSATAAPADPLTSLPSSAPDAAESRPDSFPESEAEPSDSPDDTADSAAAGARPEVPPEPAPPSPVSDADFEKEVEAIKLQGNDEFKAGRYDRATQLYSDALRLAPDMLALYLNRCMAAQRQGQAHDSLKDACLAVALDPDSYKALHKRARAKSMLRLWQAARDDLELCLDLMPPRDKSRAEVVRELADAEAHLEAAAKRRMLAEAARMARPQRVTKYSRACVTIEEHDDEEEDEQDKPLLSPEAAATLEAESQLQVMRLRARAEDNRSAWRRQRDEAAMAAYDREMRSWQEERDHITAQWEAAQEKARRAMQDKEEKKARAAPTPSPAAAFVPAPEPTPAPAAAAAADGGGAAAAAPAAASSAAASSPSPGPSVEQIKAEGNQHLQAERYGDAERCYLECLRADPDNMAVHLNLSLLYNKIQRWQQAEAEANKALELLEASKSGLHADQVANVAAKVHHRRGNARRAQGRLEAALEDLRQAKALLRVSSALDEELASLGKQIGNQRAEEAEAAAAAAAGLADGAAEAEAAQAAATLVAMGSATRVPAEAGAGDLTSGGGSRSEAAAVGAPTPTPAPVPAPAPSAPAPPSSTSQPEDSGPAGSRQAPAPAASAAAPAAASSSNGPLPARRKMQIQVEDDDSDDEEPAASQAAVRPSASIVEQSTKPAAKAEAPSVPVVAAAGATVTDTTTTAESTSKPENDKATASSAPIASPAPSPASASTAAPTSAAATSVPSQPTPATITPAATRAPAWAIQGDPGNAEEADKLRDEGNRLYAVGNYVRAMDFYNRSIRVCTFNPAAYCNRSFVHLHLKRPADALLDAEAAIEQAGGLYPKAQLRRAMALRDLGRVSDAIAAVKQLLELTPEDPALLEELQKLQKMVPANKAGAAGANGGGRAASAAPVPTQPPPIRHKIMVVEDDPDVADPEEDEQDGEEVGEQKVPGEGAAVAPAPTTTSQPATSIQPEAPPAASASAAEPASTAATAARAAGQAADANSAPRSVSPAAAANRAATMHDVASAKAAAALASRAPKKPQPPKNAHEFEQTLKSLSGHPAVLHDYIRSLDPTSYARVIKANLSTKMIQAMVDTAKHAIEQEPTPAVVSYVERSLENLTLVPRFEVTYGLCGKPVKEDVRALVTAIAAAGADVSLLKKSYKL